MLKRLLEDLPVYAKVIVCVGVLFMVTLISFPLYLVTYGLSAPRAAASSEIEERLTSHVVDTSRLLEAIEKRLDGIDQKHGRLVKITTTSNQIAKRICGAPCIGIEVPE